MTRPQTHSIARRIAGAIAGLIGAAALALVGIGSAPAAHAQAPLTFSPRPHITVPGTINTDEHGTLVTFEVPSVFDGVRTSATTCRSAPDDLYPNGLTSGDVFPVGSTVITCYADVDPSQQITFIVEVTIVQTLELTGPVADPSAPGRYTVTLTGTEWGMPLDELRVSFIRATGTPVYDEDGELVGDVICDESRTNRAGVATCTYTGSPRDTIQVTYEGYRGYPFHSNSVGG